MTTPDPRRNERPIPPRETTRVAGTDLEVWHDADYDRIVTVLSDGAVDLPAGPTWIVRVVDR